jgi:hypothetical protein
MRQVDIASKAAFTALRASSESPGAHIGLKLRGVTSAYLFGMAMSPCHCVRIYPESPVDEGIQRSEVSLRPLYRMACDVDMTVAMAAPALIGLVVK